MSNVLEPEQGTETLPLDPFGAFPGRASRIAGLGGVQPSPDPAYVFATADSRPAIGRIRAHVHFHDLAITHGTLLFEVRARSMVPGADQSRVKTITVDAGELAAACGMVELEFDSYRNSHYAIACSINDETDIACSVITLLLDRKATPDEHGLAWDWTPTAIHRRAGIEGALVERVLTDLSAPRLETPQSQVGSPLQCREPAFADAMRALGREPIPSFENWSLAYVLRAIDRYAINGARRMLGFGDNLGTLMSYQAGQGREVVGICHPQDRDAPFDPGEELGRLRVPALCDEAAFHANAHVASSNIHRTYETLYDQFDVTWSISVNRMMTPGEYVYFILHGMIHARPGALAVHVFDYVEDAGEGQGHNMTRHDIERLVVMCLAWRHDIARLQFRHDTVLPDSKMPLPFGLVILRGDAAA